MFKAGDKVRVAVPVNGVLAWGEVFTVSDGDGDMVTLKGRPATQRWFSYRFELAKEQDMTTDYPTDLQRGDVLVSSTGREYTVASVDENSNTVSYAYIPAGSNDNKIAIDTKTYRNLHWVTKVVRNGSKVWPVVPKPGDTVLYDGKEWTIKYEAWAGNLKLERTETFLVDPREVEVV